MKKVIRVVLVVVVLLMAGYLVFLNIPQATVKSKVAMEAIEAETLFEAFSSDESTAEAKYLGKVLEVRGVIDEKYEDEGGAPVVVLSGGEGDPVAMVTLEPNQKKALGDYPEGSEIRVKAMCSGMLMEVTLTKGIILKK